MALSVSGFGQALDYKIVHESAAGTTVNNNVTQSSGTLLAVTIDNTAGTHACSLKIYYGVAPTVGSTLPDLILSCPNAAKQTFQIQGGIDYTDLNFWVTKLPSPTDTTIPTVSNGTVQITLTTK